jgi:nucleoid DNA-binding protein
MNISTYLIELLRLHDCVIVPDLGGFVTNYRPAEMDLASNSFSPPRKEIIFSTKLDKNDGLLVNHISESEGVGYLEARLIVSEIVDELKSRLENGEKVELPMIGSLQYDRNERLVFEPEIRENLLLEAFGLEGFQFPQIKHSDVFNTKHPYVNKEAVRPVFSKRRVKSLAIGIPIILALLIIPATRSSWKNYSFRNNQTSSTAAIELNQPGPSVLKPAVSSKELNTEMISNPNLENKTGTSIVEKKENHAPVAAIEPSQGKYHVIGGCFRIKENADKLFSQLRERDYKSELEQLSNGNYMVTVQSYTAWDEARLALNNLSELEPQAGYWILVK